MTMVSGMDVTLVNASFGGYLFSTLLGGANLTARRSWLQTLAAAILGMGLAANIGGIAVRWVEAGRPPLSNMYESMVTFAGCIAAIMLVIEMLYRPRYLGFVAALLAVLALGTASLLDRSIQPLVPALKSNWLIAHVLFCFVGYAAFAIAFAAGIVCLVAERLSPKETLAALMDAVSYQSICFGFLFLAGGITTGAVWADQAWGTYWSWDPKETASLVTWLIYGGYLHCRLVRSWTRMQLAWLAVLGFVSVLLTYWGVNYLLPGLHSYGKP